MKRYNPKEIEPKWQQQWAEAKIYEASEDPAKPKRYVLEYFPYPSGAAMHVGHVRNYTIGDVVSRHARMTGHNVLHPMGWDAFGLPAENYAIKTGISPQQAIAENTGKFKEQLMRMGFSYDWSREFASSDPEYYKWTQWFFLLLHKKGLAYRQESLQWWCPVDKTVLANEQVENGHCWRCGSEVEKKALKQWFFKITDYADRLAKDLDDVDWSESIKSMQRNWIGRSVGAEVRFNVQGFSEDITVFTTRADTLFGATFLVLAPEHPLLDVIVPEKHRQQVENYREKVRNKSDIERQETNREKTGVFTGAYAVNPATGEDIPIWTADYVLMGYGTGAIMAVPAHDERDNQFARTFDLPIRQVVAQDFGKPLPDCKDADGVNVIGYDPQTGRFMSLQNHNVNLPWLASGGRDEGESYEENALRELHEESGYQDVKQLIPLGGMFYSYYYNDVKKVNKRARGMNYLAVISESEKIDQHTEEHESYTPQWTDLATLRDGIAKIGGGVDHWLDAIDQAGEAAKAYDASKEYIAPVFHGEGVMVNSGDYSGMRSDEAREKIVADLAQKPVEEEPLFVQTTEPGAVREDQPFVEREAITAIVKHWKEDKYIGLKWKTVDWETFITGGVEEGQTAETAAIAEIREETGYLNPVLKQDLGKTHAKFFHVPKNQNRFAHFSCLYFELTDDAREEISEDEQQNHEVVWLTADELEQFRLPESHRYIWNKHQGRGPALATEKVNYKMRDWLISRQRYWGAPIPMIHCPKDGIVPVPEDQLPVVLPELKQFEPSGDGRSPLANVPEFLSTTCPTCGGPAERETDTMDGFACSSWYFLRFADPHNAEKAFSEDKVKFWLPVDDYIGGAEHAVMHLLYARMWTKVMQDEGLIDFGEPFKALRNQGMILAPDGQKMSKSKGNTIQPDELIDQGYGADAIRIMELFIGPWNQSANWSVEGMGGSYRFLQRIWTLASELMEHVDASDPVRESDLLQKITHRTVKKVSEDLSDMGFNTAIAAMMEAVNDLYKAKASLPYGDYYAAWKHALETLLQLLAPFAPHIAEELWHELGNESSIHTSPWPNYDPKYLAEDTVTIAIQVNGKLRATVQAPTDVDEVAAVELAKADEKVAANLENKNIVKVVYVSRKLLNFVVR